MRVLLVKTSSLGDVLHALPAVTDAANAIPEVRFDWVVEESFSEVPSWHPAVDQVIPVSIRRWRKAPLQAFRSGEWRRFKQVLQERQYDLVLDAQGLVKSGLITRMANGPRYGLDKNSAREPFASFFYDYPITVEKGGHAIVRLRSLFAQALGYSVPEQSADSGICKKGSFVVGHSILFVHGTTWVTKHWPDSYWLELAKLVNKEGYEVVLPWGNRQEQVRAEWIASQSEAKILPKSSLTELVERFQEVAGMVCVDSGLAHLGAALQIPSVTLYGATNPGLTGTWGEHQTRLTSQLACSPCLKRQCGYSGESSVEPACYQDLTPQRIWKVLEKILKTTP